MLYTIWLTNTTVIALLSAELIWYIPYINGWKIWQLFTILSLFVTHNITIIYYKYSHTGLLLNLEIEHENRDRDRDRKIYKKACKYMVLGKIIFILPTTIAEILVPWHNNWIPVLFTYGIYALIIYIICTMMFINTMNPERFNSLTTEFVGYHIINITFFIMYIIINYSMNVRNRPNVFFELMSYYGSFFIISLTLMFIGALIFSLFNTVSNCICSVCTNRAQHENNQT